MQDFKKLKVWEKAHLMAVAVYQVTGTFPKDKLYGLTAQIRRAGTSIPANIAEGCGRSGDGEFNRFLHIALGSTAELEYHLLLAKDLKMIQDKEYLDLDSQISEVRKMLISFVKKIKVSQIS